MSVKATAFRAIASAGLLALAHAAAAQEPLKGGLVGNPRVGRPAPDLDHEYVTATGPSPADQRFRLSAELGRVVVLVFAGAPQEGDRESWDALMAAADSVLSPGSVIVGVLHGRSGPVQEQATGLAGTFRFLPDSTGRVHRRYGVELGKRSSGWSVFVVGDDGRLVYRGQEFRPTDASRLQQVAEATRRGHTALARP
jgi:peroxiredoxin